eukprot:TRINITY_DN14565_c0_g1_i1.p2 TRINITY_DN14565_c0_g1~~TRINITY_DN14565_c0_g1_i1.p2  ORF type:complete len:269 (+),score=64.83 TRINITY_DN14565_c0_g1_i1:63-869(+)
MYTPPPPPPPLVPSAPARPEWLELCGNLTETDLAPPFGSFAAAQCGSAWKRYESWRKARKAQPAAAPDPVEAVSCLAEDVEGGPSRGTKLTPVPEPPAAAEAWERAASGFDASLARLPKDSAAAARALADRAGRRLRQRQHLVAWLEACVLRIPYDRKNFERGGVARLVRPSPSLRERGYQLLPQCTTGQGRPLCDAVLRGLGFGVSWDDEGDGLTLGWTQEWHYSDAAVRGRAVLQAEELPPQLREQPRPRGPPAFILGEPPRGARE